MGRQLQFSTRTERDALILDVVGEIDLGTSPRLRKALLQSLDGTERMLVNMSGVRYIDSSGIASLLEIFQQARKANKRFVLFGLSASVLKVLELTRLNGIFEIRESELEALET